MNTKLWKPLVYENSKIPAFLSKFAPIDIWALSFGIFVFCRGEISDRTRRHETIHFQQQLELLFVVQWILYLLFYLLGLIRWRDGRKAYRENPFEREAYGNDDCEDYLEKRKRYCWILRIKK